MFFLLYSKPLCIDRYRRGKGGKCTFQSCDFSGFSWFPDFYFTNLPLPQNVLEKREVACIMSKPLVYCLWGCGESVNSQKLNIQEVHGALSSRPKGDPGSLPIFQDFLLLSVSFASVAPPPINLVPPFFETLDPPVPLCALNLVYRTLCGKDKKEGCYILLSCKPHSFWVYAKLPNW